MPVQEKTVRRSSRKRQALKIYYDADASLDLIRKRTVAIVGYGIQGRAQSLNLRDSGVKIIVSQRPGGPNYDKAIADGFRPVKASDAAAEADVIQILAQDHVQPEIYEKDVRPHLARGKALVFSHGFNIHFKQILPPKEIDVFMVAPKGPGSLVRTLFSKGGGVPCLLAIHQDATGTTRELGLSYARAIGGTRAGVIETTFKEETETDLFGEQTVLCGGVSALIKAAFETLVEAGYKPEIAYFECLHELKLITDMIYATGIQGMRKRVSDTAEYGDVTRGPRVVSRQTRATMRKILKEIQSGKFAKEWIQENRQGRPKFERLRHADDTHLIEQVGQQLRGMMPWIAKG